MDACTSVSAFQLVALVFTFLLAVVSLDTFWVRIPEKLDRGDIDGALRKRNWLNIFVAAGAAGALILLLFWVSACTKARSEP
jgi:hypothetical protein